MTSVRRSLSGDIFRLVLLVPSVKGILRRRQLVKRSNRAAALLRGGATWAQQIVKSTFKGFARGGKGGEGGGGAIAPPHHTRAPSPPTY